MEEIFLFQRRGCVWQIFSPLSGPDDTEKCPSEQQSVSVTCCEHQPEDGQRFGADVLTAVLDARDQVRHELVYGTLVDHGSRHTLSHFYLITFTANKSSKNCVKNLFK